MLQGKQYYYLIPKRVYRQIGLLETNHFRKIPAYRREWMLEVISVIANKTRRDNEPVPIHSGIIQTIVPNGHKYLMALIRSGVIERLGQYEQGAKSYEYRFAAKYDSTFKKIPVTDPKSINRIAGREFDPPRGRPAKRHEQDKFLPGLKIDAEPAYQWITDNIPHVAINHVNAYMAAVNRIVEGSTIPKTDNTSGRHHTVLTNLPKYLKQFVTLYGDPIENVDLKNSQPFLSTMLLMDPARLTPFAKSKDLKRMFRESLHPVGGHDVIEYILQSHSGMLYEYMIRQFGSRGMTIDRDAAKEIMFKILYGENGHNSAMRSVFVATFPTVAAQFDRVRGNDPSDNKYVNYKRFAILLQSVESYLILELVIPRFRREYPNIPILSVHDSITTSTPIQPIAPERYTVKVKNIMEQEIGDWYGIRPTIEIEKPPRSISEKSYREMLSKYVMNNNEREGLIREYMRGEYKGAGG